MATETLKMRYFSIVLLTKKPRYLSTHSTRYNKLTKPYSLKAVGRMSRLVYKNRVGPPQESYQLMLQGGRTFNLALFYR